MAYVKSQQQKKKQHKKNGDENLRGNTKCRGHKKHKRTHKKSPSLPEMHVRGSLRLSEAVCSFHPALRQTQHRTMTVLATTPFSLSLDDVEDYAPVAPIRAPPSSPSQDENVDPSTNAPPAVTIPTTTTMDLGSTFPNYVDHTRASVHHVDTNATVSKPNLQLQLIKECTEADCNAILVQLYWLVLNGIATSETVFRLERAPFADAATSNDANGTSIARFRINYYVTSTRGANYRTELLCRYKLVAIDKLGEDIYDTSSVVRQSWRRNGQTMKLYNYCTPLEQALQQLQIYHDLCLRVAQQFASPIRAIVLPEPHPPHGLGYWIALCDHLHISKLNSFAEDGLNYVSTHAISLVPFSTRTYLQWDNRPAPVRRFANNKDIVDLTDDEDDYLTSCSKKRKAHFDKYLPEAKRLVAHPRHSIAESVVVMPSYHVNGSILGVFATRDFAPGEEITSFAGLVDIASTERPSLGKFAHTHRLALTYGAANVTIDGVRYPVAGFGSGSMVVSSSHPSCSIERPANAFVKIHHNRLTHRATIRAKTFIIAGDEILLNYPQDEE